MWAMPSSKSVLLIGKITDGGMDLLTADAIKLCELKVIHFSDLMHTYVNLWRVRLYNWSYRSDFQMAAPYGPQTGVSSF